MGTMSRVIGFLLRFAVVGLALAFVVVLIKPELLRPRAASAPAPAAVPAPPAVPASGAGPQVTSYADAVARSAPAVVNIYTARVVTERALPSQWEQLLGDTWPRMRQRIESSLGSGVIIDSEGHIVTNNHVVAQAAEIQVQIADGRVAQARILGRDPDTDLAVLEVELTDLPTMPLGRSDTLRVGDVVLAIGNPLGLSQTVTQGIVSATGRGQLGVADFENFIQTDAAINFGNSGGALVNTSGELIGINTAMLARNSGIEGISFAIPVNLVRGVMQEIIRNGRVIRGWIGVDTGDLSAEQARVLGIGNEPLVVIARLDVNGPALQAGMRAGDVITHLDGRAIQSSAQARAHVASLAPGARVQIRALRRGQAFEVTVPVAERPIPRS
jgi:Do/DeqQ family serine protease